MVNPEMEGDRRDEASDKRASELFDVDYVDKPQTQEEKSANLDKRLEVLRDELKAQEERKERTKSKAGKESVDATISDLNTEIAKTEKKREQLSTE